MSSVLWRFSPTLLILINIVSPHRWERAEAVGNDVKPASTIYTDFVKSHGTVRVGGESSHRLRQHASTGAATEGDKEADAHVAHGRFQQPAASLTGDHGTIVGKEVAEREKQQQQHYTPSLTSSASSMGASVKRQQPTTSAVGGVVVVKGAEVGPSRTRPRIPPVSTNDAEGKVKAEKEHEQGDDDLQQMAIQYAGSLRRNHSGPAAAAAKKGHTYTDPIDVEAPSPHGEGRGVERTRSPVARNRIHAEGKKKQKQKIERKRRREHVDDATEEDTSISGPTRRPSSSSHHHNHHQQKRKRSDGKKKIDDPTNRTQKKKRRRRDEQKSAEIYKAQNKYLLRLLEKMAAHRLRKKKPKSDSRRRQRRRRPPPTASSPSSVSTSPSASLSSTESKSTSEPLSSSESSASDSSASESTDSLSTSSSLSKSAPLPKRSRPSKIPPHGWVAKKRRSNVPVHLPVSLTRKSDNGKHIITTMETEEETVEPKASYGKRIRELDDAATTGASGDDDVEIVKVVNEHDGSKPDGIGASAYKHSTSSRGTSGRVKRRKGNLDIDLNVLPIGQSSPTPPTTHSPKDQTTSSLHSLMQPAHSTLLRQPTSPAEARSPTYSTLSSAGKSKKTNSLDIDLNETHPIDPSQQMSPVNTLHQSTTTSNSKTLSNVSPTNSNTGVLDGVEEPKQKSILKEKRIITASHNLNVPRTPHDEVSTVIDDALLTSKSSNSEHASKHPPNDLTKFDSFNGIHKLHNDRMANFDLNLPEQSTKPINGLHMDIYKKHMHQPVVAHRNQEHQLLETNALGQHPHDAHHDEARREEVDILNAHHVEVPTLEAHHSEGHNVEEYLVEPHPVKPHSVEGHHDETQHVHSHTIDGDPPKAHRPAEAHNKVEQIGHHPLDAHHVDAHREEAETLDARIVEVPTTFDELHVEAVKNKPHSVEGHHEETHHVQSQIIEGDPPEAQRPVEDHNKVEVHQPSQIDTEKTHHDVNQPNKSDHFEGRREEAHFPEVHHVETNHVEIHPNKPNPVEKQPVEQHLPVQNTIEARQKVHKNQPEEMDIGFKSPKPMVKTPTLFEKDQPLDEHQTVGTQQTKEAYKPLEEQHIEAVQALEAQNLEKQRTFEPQYPVETRLHSELPHSIKVRQSSAAAHQADKSHQSVDLDGAHHPVEVHHTNEASKHGESHQPAMKHQINGVQKLTIEAHQPAYLPNEAHNLRNEEQLIKTKHHVKSDQLTEGSRPMETRHSVDAQLPIRETHQPAEAHQPVNVPQTVEKHLRSEGQHPIESRQQLEIHDVNQHVDDPTSEAHHPLGAQHPPEAERDLGAHQNIEAHQPLEAIHQKSKPTQRATGHGESSQSLEGHHLIQSNRIFEPHPHKTQIEEEHGKEKTSQTSDSKNPKYIHKDETINSGASRHSVESSHSLGVSHSDEPQQLLGLPFASTSLINWGMYMQPSKTIGNPSIEELLRVSQRHFDRHNRFFDRAHSRRLSQDLNEMPEPPREQQGNRQGETNENHSSTSHKEDNTTEKLHQNAHHMESDAVDKTAGEAHQRKPAGEASKPKKSHHPNEARRPGACSN